MSYGGVFGQVALIDPTVEFNQVIYLEMLRDHLVEGLLFLDDGVHFIGEPLELHLEAFYFGLHLLYQGHA